jgi:hypothetical protein
MKARSVLSLYNVALLADRLDRIENADPDAGADQSERAVPCRRVGLEHILADNARDDQRDQGRTQKGRPAFFIPEDTEAFSGINCYL